MKIVQDVDKTTIVAKVTEFSESIGYCEHRIEHFLAGIKPPPKPEMIKGGEKHEEEEKYEEEHFEAIPITVEELSDIEKDIEFFRDKIYTRFLFEFEKDKILLILIGRADKVYRSKGTLFIEDTKFTKNPEKYTDIFEPYEDQKLQILGYLNSIFTDAEGDESFNPSNWFSIPHKKKGWIIHIKDMDSKKTVKIFKGIQSKEIENLLIENIRRFCSLILGIVEPQHHNNFKKCLSCRFNEECKDCLEN